MRPRAGLILVFLLFFGGGVVLAEQAAAKPGVKSDRGVYPPPPAPALPKAGGVAWLCLVRSRARPPNSG